MTVLVDEARWLWRGERWAHLCSDTSIDELHAFAGRLGLRRVSFQGDHYDVTAPCRADAVAAGAVAIGSRELVRRLRASGQLRRAARAGYRWQLVGQLPVAGGEALRAEGHGLGLSPDQLDGLAGALDLLVEASVGALPLARLLSRPVELAVVVSGDRAPDGAHPWRLLPLGPLVDSAHHTDDGPLAVTELFVARQVSAGLVGAGR